MKCPTCKKDVSVVLITPVLCCFNCIDKEMRKIAKRIKALKD